MISIGRYYNLILPNFVANPIIYIYLPIGGWNAGSGSYSMMAADPQKRKTFIDSLSDFLDTYHFDGVDLDWVSLGQSRVFSVVYKIIHYTCLINLNFFRNILETEKDLIQKMTKKISVNWLQK